MLDCVTRCNRLIHIISHGDICVSLAKIWLDILNDKRPKLSERERQRLFRSKRRPFFIHGPAFACMVSIGKRCYKWRRGLVLMLHLHLVMLRCVGYCCSMLFTCFADFLVVVLIMLDHSKL